MISIEQGKRDRGGGDRIAVGGEEVRQRVTSVSDEEVFECNSGLPMSKQTTILKRSTNHDGECPQSDRSLVHVNDWDFSLRRSNLQMAELAGERRQKEDQPRNTRAKDLEEGGRGKPSSEIGNCNQTENEGEMGARLVATVRYRVRRTEQQVTKIKHKVEDGDILLDDIAPHSQAKRQVNGEARKAEERQPDYDGKGRVKAGPAPHSPGQSAENVEIKTEIKMVPKRKKQSAVKRGEKDEIRGKVDLNMSKQEKERKRRINVKQSRSGTACETAEKTTLANHRACSPLLANEKPRLRARGWESYTDHPQPYLRRCPQSMSRIENVREEKREYKISKAIRRTPRWKAGTIFHGHSAVREEKEKMTSGDGRTGENTNKPANSSSTACNEAAAGRSNSRLNSTERNLPSHSNRHRSHGLPVFNVEIHIGSHGDRESDNTCNERTTKKLEKWN
ncbi:hypothetical protein ACHWQZ_G005822 [Mnemiopsis leidyi]